MTILRGMLPSDHFTMVPNAWLRDPKISAKAKGLLCYIASHAVGYVLTVEQMLREMTDAETAIRSGLRELERAGYLTKVRQRGERGRLGAYEWTIGKTAAQDQTTFSSLDDTSMEDSSLDNVVTKKTTEEETTSKKITSETSFNAEASPTAQTIIGGFIDWLALPNQGAVQLTRRVIGIYAKSIKQLLGEGFDELLIKKALVEMHQRGMTGRPTLLEGFVVQVQNRPVSAPPASGGPKLFEEMRENRTAQRLVRSQLIDATMDRLRAENPGMSVAETVRLAAQYVDAELKRRNEQLSGRTGTGYIKGDVIDIASKEVTGSAA